VPIAGTDSDAGRNPPAPDGLHAAPAGSPAGDHSDRGSAPTSAQLKAAVDSANRQLDQSNRELTFVFDDTLGRMLIKIVDKRTNSVVRQVPSEDMLVMARALSESASRGVLLKSRA